MATKFYSEQLKSYIPILRCCRLVPVPVASQVVKNPPASADVRDKGLIPGWGRSPGAGNGNHSCILSKSHGHQIR